MFRSAARILVISTLFFCINCQSDENYMRLLKQLYKLTNDYSTLRPTMIKTSEDNISDYNLMSMLIRRYINKVTRKNSMDRNEEYRRSMHKEHLRKVHEIGEFIKTHPLTTNYFYEEMLRIQRQNTVKDDLRKMVSILENIPEMKKEILEIFQKFMKNVEKFSDFWERKPNDLVINPFGANVIDPTYN